MTVTGADFDALLSNPWFIAVVTIVAAGVVGVLLNHLTRREGRICLSGWSNNLVGGLKTQAKGLSVTFNGEEIPAASVGRIAIWNDGNTVVKRESVDPKDPIVVELTKGQRLLEYSVLFASDSRSGFTVEPCGGSNGGEALRLRFDYLKPSQGAAVQIVYTGTTVADFHLSGTLVDFPVPKWVPTRRRWLPLGVIVVSYAYLFAVVGPLSSLPFDSASAELAKVAYTAVAAAPVVAAYALRGKIARYNFRLPQSLTPYCEGVTTKPKSP